MNKKFTGIIAIVVAVNLILTAIIGISMLKPSYDEQYALYVGVLDGSEAVKAEINGIVESHIDGYTLFDAAGAWKDDAGKEYDEYTYVYEIFFETEKTVKAIADDILANVDGSAVLMVTKPSNATHSSTWSK